jgi:hypothetical protein
VAFDLIHGHFEIVLQLSSRKRMEKTEREDQKKVERASKSEVWNSSLLGQGGG